MFKYKKVQKVPSPLKNKASLNLMLYSSGSEAKNKNFIINYNKVCIFIGSKIESLVTHFYQNIKQPCINFKTRLKMTE